jgi:hypothetical protein
MPFFKAQKFIQGSGVRIDSVCKERKKEKGMSFIVPRPAICMVRGLAIWVPYGRGQFVLETLVRP